MEYKGIKGNWEIIDFDLKDFKQICIASDESQFVLAHFYLPENKITDEIKATANLMASAKVLFDALNELIQVKEYKDNNGKDEHYLNAKDIAWDNAKKAIKNAII